MKPGDSPDRAVADAIDHWTVIGHWNDNAPEASWSEMPEIPEDEMKTSSPDDRNESDAERDGPADTLDRDKPKCPLLLARSCYDVRTSLKSSRWYLTMMTSDPGGGFGYPYLLHKMLRRCRHRRLEDLIWAA